MTISDPPPIVLLVEDELFVRMTTLDMLEEVGCVVLEAANGAEALALLESTDRIDLLVTDVGLPDIGGLELYAICAKTCPGLPVLFITGYGAQDLQDELAGQPLVAVLGKPYQLRELKRALQSGLDAARQRHGQVQVAAASLATGI